MTILSCPSCYSTDVDTVELLWAIAKCVRITPDGPEFSGDTEYLGDTQETVGVTCNNCKWEYEGINWLDQLVPLK